jgi:hypothetical protein
MQRNNNKLLVLKYTFSLFEFIFQILCLSILFYQFIDITNNYLNFAYEVKLNVSDYKGLNLPSITFCFKNDKFWQKSNYKNFCIKLN